MLSIQDETSCSFFRTDYYLVSPWRNIKIILQGIFSTIGKPENGAVTVKYKIPYFKSVFINVFYLQLSRKALSGKKTSVSVRGRVTLLSVIFLFMALIMRLSILL